MGVSKHTIVIRLTQKQMEEMSRLCLKFRMKRTAIIRKAFQMLVDDLEARSDW